MSLSLYRCLWWSKYFKVLFCVNIYDSVCWSIVRGVDDGVGRDVYDELDSGFYEGVELEVGGTVVSIKMQNMKLMWRLVTVYI